MRNTSQNTETDKHPTIGLAEPRTLLSESTPDPAANDTAPVLKSTPAGPLACNVFRVPASTELPLRVRSGRLRGASVSFKES